MNEIEKICGALQQKKKLFAAYENCTEQLLQCEAESMEHYITQRSQLAIEIDEIDEKIDEMCERGDEKQLRTAIQNACAYDVLSAEIRPVFIAAQEVLGYISRIAASEPLIQARMETFLEEYRQKITEVQNAPKIARYLSGMQSDYANIGLLGSRYDKA